MMDGSRNRLYRNIFIFVILGTLPLYCIGFALWGFGPASSSAPIPRATNTTIGNEQFETETPSRTPVTRTPLSTLPPTPFQFNPVPTSAFVFQTWTPTMIFLLTPTDAPTLTVVPTNTFIPPTNTFIPPPTNTFVPPPTNTLQPTETWTPVPQVEIPTQDILPPPTDTPNPGS
jgi:hypothetical protein